MLARANLVLAWKRVKANRGSAGVDGLTIAATWELLKTDWPRLREELQTGRYRPQPVRRVQIPKPGGGVRELGIPTVKDRIVQAAVKRVIEPIFEREFLPTSYGFRPGRGCKDALREVDRLLRGGYTHVVDADLKSYLDRSSHYTSVCGVGAEEIGRSGR